MFRSPVLLLRPRRNALTERYAAPVLGESAEGHPCGYQHLQKRSQALVLSEFLIDPRTRWAKKGGNRPEPARGVRRQLVCSMNQRTTDLSGRGGRVNTPRHFRIFNALQ